MPEFQKSTTQTIRNRPSTELVLLGGLAVLIVQAFRASFQPDLWLVYLETIVYVATPIALLSWLLSSSGSKTLALEKTSTKYLLQLGAIFFAMLPLLVQSLVRSFGSGDSNEIVILMMIQNAAWYLTVLAAFWNFARVAFPMSCALVLFVCFTADSWTIYALALFFSLIAMWWLMGNYWSRLETKVLDGKSKTMPIRWSFLAVSAFLVGGIGLIAWSSEPIAQAISLDGFMPTSGGNDWSDDFARAGIGDGDMLIGGDDATTVGAVDSDTFIEDSRPSIYDAVNDMFDEPVIRIKKNRNKAITLEDKSKHLHDIKQSEQSGKSFRTVRKRGRKPKKRKYEDVVTDALFFVEGSVPVRFKVGSFNHFDGWDWTNKELDWTEQIVHRISLVENHSKPWYVLTTQDRQFLDTGRGHRIKVMRLKSEAMPTPPFLDRWHIHKVNRRDMFTYQDTGVVDFGSKLPPQTMIDMYSKVPNYHTLRASNNFVVKSTGLLDWFDQRMGVVKDVQMSQGNDFRTEDDTSLQMVQVPEDATKQRLAELADEWVGDVAPGWRQVEGIITRLRDDFVVDPGEVADPECENAIGHFLDNKSGPSYMFATAATQMLRAAGYKTRLATGFLVQEEDYSRIANQSAVTRENLHIWPEVCLENCHWIPLEPTPGYPIPFSNETVGQYLKRKIAEVFALVLRNPLKSLFVLIFGGGLVWARAEVYTLGCWIIWFVVFHLSSKRRLAVTRRLIDARFQAARVPRPKFALVKQWFNQVDPAIDQGFFSLWQAANFSKRSLDMRDSLVSSACKQLVADLPYKKIAQFAKRNKKS